jgi:beta-galactosidase
MVQLENEYGSYSNDKSYLELNRKIFRDAGFDGLLFTCDGADKMADGHLPGYLPAVNGLEDTAEIKKVINKYHDGKGPYYVAEWYPGWFDQWGKQHANVSPEKNAEKLNSILKAGMSINMYMFHGGTTRDFMNGANMNINDPYAPQVSSYDYDAPLDEAGNPTPKYLKFRETIINNLPAGTNLPAVPANKRSISIADIKLTGYAALFDQLPAPVSSNSPLPFEDLDQAYGSVLYRSILPATDRGYLKLDGLRDYAIVYINGKKTGVLDRRLNQDSLLLTAVPANAVLDILVENNGRINYGPYLTDNRKGILGHITLNKKIVAEWKMYGFPFTDMKKIRFKENTGKTIDQPALYKGTVEISDTADTYFDMRGFGKGFVYLNGHNLGKYWEIGPQQTIYVPACWLKKGINEVIVYDELKYGHTTLSSLSGAILNQPKVITK